MQQVAVLDTATGEVSERQLAHDGSAVEEFYAALPRPVTIGIESTGYATWFHTLIQRLGHTLLVGDAAKMRAMVVRCGIGLLGVPGAVSVRVCPIMS
jgi:transposase